MMTAVDHRTPDFETLYLQLRQKERRVYTDEETGALPLIDPTHAHYAEWLVRRHSSRQLIEYLERKNKSLSILEVGCGNGWLANQLAHIPASRVTATDINFSELQQGARVFAKQENLVFIYGEAEEDLFERSQFDTIVFAASIQYFPSLPRLFRKILPLLKSQGEIHLIDTHFYSLAGMAAARQRSQHYYQAMGFPEMAAYYHHHTLDELEEFNHSILYDPGSLFNRFLKNKHPFHWIIVRA